MDFSNSKLNLNDDGNYGIGSYKYECAIHGETDACVVFSFFEDHTSKAFCMYYVTEKMEAAGLVPLKEIF